MTEEQTPNGPADSPGSRKSDSSTSRKPHSSGKTVAPDAGGRVDDPASEAVADRSPRVTTNPPSANHSSTDESATSTSAGSGTSTGQSHPSNRLSDEDDHEHEDQRPGGISADVDPAPTSDSHRIRSRRSRGLEIVAAGMIGLGLLTGAGSAFILTIPVILAILYHRATTLPDISLSATRAVSQVQVVPGETVTVTVTVTNSGETSIPDLRLRDSVPERLQVIEGSPMATVSLEPGGSATFEYKVTARRGKHRFATVEAICRNVSGSVRDRQLLEAERTLIAQSSLDGMPLDASASQYTGRLETSFRGSGVEFYSTREYHPSDSPRNIDWRTFAKTREFTTVEYKDTRAASIHIIVDRREAAHEQTGATAVTAREMSLYAAEHVATYLIEDRHKLGVTSITDESVTYLPEKNPNQYRRVRRQFHNGETAGSGAFGRLDAGLADRFVANTASYTQFVCVTGLYDDGFDAFLERIAKHDRPVLVISPRLEMVPTPGSKLTMLKREIRMEVLRREGVRVLDWNTDEPLRLAIERRVGGLWK